jgi:hypothetical protein
MPRDRESKVKENQLNTDFQICFENGSSHDGYVTEKINDGFRSGGNSDIPRIS